MSLIVAPALTDVAGPRIHARSPASPHPCRVSRVRGAQAGIEAHLRRLGSFVLIVLSSPIMLAVAIAVKLSSPGPVFYSQERSVFAASRFRC